MSSLEEKIIRNSRRKMKEIVDSFKREKEDTKLLFILGYGRSGTYLVFHLFEHLSFAECYGESGNTLMEDFLLKEEVMVSKLNASKSDWLVLKPILNSYQVDYFLNRYRDMRIIWVYRDYRDVVASMLKKFGPEVGGLLKNRIQGAEGNDWISRHLPDIEKKEISKLDYSSFTDEDWAALVWWSVNSVLFSKDIVGDERIKLMEYSDFVHSASPEINGIEHFLKIDVNVNYSKYVSPFSVGKGKNIMLDGKVEEMCSGLLDRLRAEKNKDLSQTINKA